MDILEIRRAFLRKLMRDHGGAKLAELLGYRQSSFLSQMAGPNPTRDITEKTARAYEKQLGLEPGSFDKPLPPEDSTSQAPTPPAAPDLASEDLIALVLNATRKLGAICEAENVNLPPSKFANVLALVLRDTVDHGSLRESRIKEVVELLK